MLILWSMKHLKIRFNTKFLEGDPRLKWRIIQDDQEFLAEEIKISVPTYTTEDIIETGETKWHVSCDGSLSWQGKKAFID